VKGPEVVKDVRVLVLCACWLLTVTNFQVGSHFPLPRVHNLDLRPWYDLGIVYSSLGKRLVDHPCNDHIESILTSLVPKPLAVIRMVSALGLSDDCDSEACHSHSHRAQHMECSQRDMCLKFKAVGMSKQGDDVIVTLCSRSYEDYLD
jgi:hypothetical protein